MNNKFIICIKFIFLLLELKTNKSNTLQQVHFYAAHDNSCLGGAVVYILVETSELLLKRMLVVQPSPLLGTVDL